MLAIALLIALAAVVLGLALLVWSGDRVVDEAVALALHRKPSPAAAVTPVALDVLGAPGAPIPQRRAIFWLVIGLAVLLGSAHLLIWGVFEIAQGCGVSDPVTALALLPLLLLLGLRARRRIGASRGRRAGAASPHRADSQKAADTRG